MNTTHTPLPWVRRGTTLWAAADKPPMGHEIIANTRTAKGDAHDEANAAFIERACNSHEELLTVLKRLQPIFTRLSQTYEADNLTDAEWTIHACDAIAKAEGKA